VFLQEDTGLLLELGHVQAGGDLRQVDDGAFAKRFDMLVLRAQLSILQARPDFMGLRQKIQTIAVNLEDEVAIPAIKAEAALIHAVASDEWWQDVTVPMLETARRRLRALVKLLPKGQKKVVYTDFEDEVGRQADQQGIEVPEDGAVLLVHRAVRLVDDDEVEVPDAETALPVEGLVDETHHRRVGRHEQ